MVKEPPWRLPSSFAHLCWHSLKLPGWEGEILAHREPRDAGDNRGPFDRFRTDGEERTAILKRGFQVRTGLLSNVLQ